VQTVLIGSDDGIEDALCDPWPTFAPPKPVTADEVAAVGYWSPLMSGGGALSELVLTPDGDAIMAWTSTP
jgi:hypothetical protein